jgi:hypothetical protein
MRAHDDMGRPDVNITYETLARAAAANGSSIEKTIATINKTVERDRGDHPGEYAEEATAAG